MSAAAIIPWLNELQPFQSVTPSFEDVQLGWIQSLWSFGSPFSWLSHLVILQSEPKRLVTSSCCTHLPVKRVALWLFQDIPGPHLKCLEDGLLYTYSRTASFAMMKVQKPKSSQINDLDSATLQWNSRRALCRWLVQPIQLNAVVKECKECVQGLLDRAKAEGYCEISNLKLSETLKSRWCSHWVLVVYPTPWSVCVSLGRA